MHFLITLTHLRWSDCLLMIHHRFASATQIMFLWIEVEEQEERTKQHSHALIGFFTHMSCILHGQITQIAIPLLSHPLVPCGGELAMWHLSKSDPWPIMPKVFPEPSGHSPCAMWHPSATCSFMVGMATHTKLKRTGLFSFVSLAIMPLAFTYCALTKFPSTTLWTE